MSIVMASSLGIGISCMLFPFIASVLKMSVWMSFAGCTSYYVAGGGKNGFIKSLCCNFTGIAWAMLVIWFTGLEYVKNLENAAFFIGAAGTGAIAFAMTYQSRINLLAFVPSTFIGCFSTFGSGGDWKLMSISILAGNVLGVCCDYSGRLLLKAFGKRKEAEESPATLETD